MKPDRTVSKTRKFVTAFAGDQSGAVAAYVAILIAVLVGFAGLAVDMGRFYTTHSQAQAAADAAALAAATQLDGRPDAIARATIAAMSTPLVNNNQDFAEGDATVQIVRLRFLHSLPPSDDEETLTQLNIFLAAVGATSGDTLAVAVAGFNSFTCKIPPLMICNPWEGSSKTFTELNNELRGVTLLAKTKEGGVDSWDSGVMGLLDPPPTCIEDDGVNCLDWDTSTNNGTKQVALGLARVPEEFCFPNAPISPRTGQASAMRTGVNTWFDIYENPFFGSNKYRTDPDFRPARNVTKGYITEWVTTDILDADGNVIGTSTSCESTPVDDPTITMGLPPDSCFGTGPDNLDFSNPVPCSTTSKGPVGSEARIGDGNWNLAAYWSVNHPQWISANPTKPYPDELAGATRFEVYRYEINNGMIPNKDNLSTPAVEGENGNPICYGGGVVPNDVPDRRVLSVAVINCEAEGITGNSADVENRGNVIFADLFVLRPIRGGDDGNIWLEFIKFSDDRSKAHDIVQLYR
jgi:hypothetical protein